MFSFWINVQFFFCGHTVRLGGATPDLRVTTSEAQLPFTHNVPGSEKRARTPVQAHCQLCRTLLKKTPRLGETTQRETKTKPNANQPTRPPTNPDRARDGRTKRNERGRARTKRRPKPPKKPTHPARPPPTREKPQEPPNDSLSKAAHETMTSQMRFYCVDRV